MSGGTLSIAAGTAGISNLTVNGGTLAGAGSATIGNLALSSGGVGIATFTLTGPSSTWTGGNWNGPSGSTATIAAGAALGISYVNDHHYFDYRLVTNNGTVNWSSGYIRGGHGGGFINNLTWNDTNTSGVAFDNYYGSTAPSFTNSVTGTYTKTGTGAVAFNAPFHNDGSVSVQAGTLSLNGGGNSASTGTFAVSPGATINFGGGTSTLANGTSLSGAGTFGLSSGTLSIAAGTATISNLVVNGGTLAGAGSATIANLALSSGGVGIATFTLTGPSSTWTGGNWNGPAGSTATIAAGATLGISYVHDHHYYDSRLVTNNGTVNWSSGYIRGGHGGGFVNNLTWNDTNSSSVAFDNYYGSTAPSFTNSVTGTYTKSGTGAVTFNIPFHNAGSVQVQAGTLWLNQGGTNAATGVIAAAPGTTVQFTNDFTVADGAGLTGGGDYILSAGTFTVGGTLNGSTFQQTGGTLGGTHTLTGTYNWASGNWNAAAGSPITTIASGATLNLVGTGTKDFSQRAIVNQGTVNWSPSYLRSGQGGSFTNAAGGTFNDLNSAGYTVHNPYGGTFAFTNDGSYVRNVGGTTYFDTTFNNNGTLDLQQGDIHLRQGGSMGSTSVVNGALGTNLYFTNDYTLIDGSRFIGPGNFMQTGGTLTINGNLKASAFNWHAGNWNAASAATTIVHSTTVLNLVSGNSKDFNVRSITNHGTVNWESGYIRAGGGSVFTNAANGTFNDQNTSSYTIHNPFGGTFAFTNDGTYNRNAGGTTYFDTTFNNNGTINLQQGDIQIRQGGTMGATGTVSGAPGTNFYLTNNYTLENGSRFIGAGNFYQTGGTLTFDNLTATAFNWFSGNWNGAGASAIDASSVVNFVSGNSKDLNARHVTNHGTVNWQQGYIRGGSGSVFTNAADGTFQDQNVSGYTVHNPFGGTFVFRNDGTYRRNTGGTTYFDTTFDNHGTVDLQQGEIQIRQGGTMSASSVVQVAAGADFNFTNLYTLLDGAQFQGAGTVWQTGGTLTVEKLRATKFNWYAGDWNSAANSGVTSVIAAGTVLSLTSGNSKDFSGRIIANEGIMNWEAGYIRGGHGSQLVNSGTFNDLNAPGYTFHNPFGGNFTITNSGLYRRSVTGTTQVQVPFTNTGTVRAEAGTIAFGSTFTNTGGTVLAAGGNLSFANPLDVGTGRIGGAGTITASTVTAAGDVTPGNSVGLLTIAGNLTLQPNARSQFELGGTTRGSTYDAINVSGTATLAGTLEFSFVSGAYASLVGTENFTLLGATTVTGGFGNIASGFRLQSADGVGSFLVTVSGTNVTLSNFILSPTTYIWSGGDLSTAGNVTPALLVDRTVPVGAAMAIVTSADHDFNGQILTNDGRIDWSGGRLRSGDGGGILNRAIFNDAVSVNTDINADYGNHVATFTNAAGASYNKVGNATTRFLDVPFLNSGTVNVGAGTLQFHGGGTNSGTGVINAATGALVLFSNNYTLADGSVLAGPGTFELFSGAVVASGTVQISRLNQTGGSLGGTHTFTNSLLNWTAGDWNTGAAATTTLANGSRLVLTGGDHDYNTRAIVNQGIVDWNSGRLRSGGGGSFTNQATFNDNVATGTDVNADYGNHVASFVNALGATYTKTAASVTRFLDVPFSNHGLVNVNAGTLQLQGGGTLSGTGVVHTANGALTLFTNNYTLASGAQLTGAGTYELRSGNLGVNGTVKISNLLQTGGTLDGTHTFANSLLNWTAGSWNAGAAATTTIASGSRLVITGGDHDYNTRAIINQGIVDWNSGRLRSGDGGSFTNQATFNDHVTAGTDVNADWGNHVASFTNAFGAVYSKTGNATTRFLDVPFNNEGTVNVDAGTLQLHGGGTLAATGRINTAAGPAASLATTTFSPPAPRSWGRDRSVPPGAPSPSPAQSKSPI